MTSIDDDSLTEDYPIYPGGITISCGTCSRPKMLYPPSTEYTEIRLENCPRNDTKMGNYSCSHCKNVNEYFWHKKHNPDNDRFIPSV
ncbi:MAG TPA: hypothetical protein VH500_21355 [Nitrososphaeraceae archaeon]